MKCATRPFALGSPPAATAELSPQDLVGAPWQKTKNISEFVEGVAKDAVDKGLLASPSPSWNLCDSPLQFIGNKYLSPRKGLLSEEKAVLDYEGYVQGF